MRLESTIWRLAGGFASAKGAVLAALVTGLGIEFWKALIIAVVAALIGFAGSMLSAYYSVREARKNRLLVEDVSRKVSADRRAGDVGPGNGDDAP